MTHAASLSRQAVREAARELNAKKNSWNPFKSASDAGMTLREWKQKKTLQARSTKKHVAAARSARTTRASTGRTGRASAAKRGATSKASRTTKAVGRAMRRTTTAHRGVRTHVRAKKN